MAGEKNDNWSSQEYQHSAAFVPKLATKVVQWLDVGPDDVILDIGCGDGLLDVEFGHVLAQGKGFLHGIDASPAMIEAATEAVAAAGVQSNCTFHGTFLDANSLAGAPSLPRDGFTKAFSNAALHWILRPETAAAASSFFAAVRDRLVQGGTLVFEMGGLGNVAEMRTALLMASARRVGMARAVAADPWFFPDEAWVRRQLEGRGWEVEKVEREWRPTKAGEGGVEGWVRLMGKEFLRAVEEEAGKEAVEEVVREAAEALRVVCDDGDGGEMISYVRLRCLARKL
ncbi:S-adenosyl-L-methionine-dependent methyltransferase [Sodiomyces alkalinus F11]|uniref:S-adenosyl-L-methionine-dependent methyltransferase n=1 Tax=Sodiomyces alkalinus (strain CBS 110278 / VKM F-3762 / F11) TaxID=1314773 RepID=A0A3N2QA89_SODAK|nr:S-adenosyl-L-methionine-dependent methyltransferase [Sodiomyces alkalinus F11]ROT43646.1 S-adenosyl-L-methionine-dependent methyltransferase [Sodiomyces alkalinus F11]